MFLRADLPGETKMIRHRFLVILAAVAAALVLVTADAHARAGGGFSGGSRGMRTFSPPPATQTAPNAASPRSEEHTSELQSRENLVCRLLLEKKKKNQRQKSQNKKKKK